MRNPEGDGLGHRRMRQEDLVDFARGDLLPAAVDHLFEAPGEEQVAVVIQESEITGPEPAVLRDLRASDHHLARLPRRPPRAGRVHDGDLRARRHTDRSRLARARRQGVAGDLVRRLRHAVGLDHGRCEDPLQLGAEPRRQRRRRGADEAEPPPGDDVGVERRALQHRVMDRRDRRVPGRAALVEPAEDARCVELRRDRHAGARQQRRQHGHEPVNVEQRHDVEAAIALGEGERRRHVPRRCADVGVRQQHGLGLRRRARRVEHERHVVRPDGVASRLAGGRASAQRECTGRIVTRRRQLQHSHAQPSGDTTRGRVRARRDDERSGVQRRKMTLEFRGAVGGIERDAGGDRRRAKQSDGHLRTVSDRDGDAVAAGDTPALQGQGDVVDLADQTRIRERRPGRRDEGDRVGRAFGVNGEVRQLVRVAGIGRHHRPGSQCNFYIHADGRAVKRSFDERLTHHHAYGRRGLSRSSS